MTSVLNPTSIVIERAVAVHAVAFPYAPRHTDFLVVRARSGALSLRQVSGTVIAGQQEPNMIVPVPRSKEARCALPVSSSKLVVSLREYNLPCLVTHVCRGRVRQSKHKVSEEFLVVFG